MQKRLIILSDLWGLYKSEWLLNYTQILSDHFDIVYYDCCALGEINQTDYIEEKLHNQFVSGGIEKAVEKLLQIETSRTNILAFSIGGTIAWKYGLRSNNIEQLICVSSTRLRYETVRPSGDIALFFGEYDAFNPPISWFDPMKLNSTILKGREHQFYQQREFARELSHEIINWNELK